MFIEVVRAVYVKDYLVSLTFNDGLTKTVNFEPLLEGKVYEPLKDVEAFRRFSVKFNTIEWENGADFAPEFLHDYPGETDAVGHVAEDEAGYVLSRRRD